MRTQRTRTNDATFDLNLAPILDIIVSIVPMLLLSVAFVQVKMIEAPTPQVVEEQANKTPPKPETQVLLHVSKKTGFTFEITDTKGKVTTTKIGLNAEKQYDLDGLLASAMKVKEANPEVAQVQLSPEADVPFDDIVKVLDQIRLKPRAQADHKISISEATSAKAVENVDLFPNVIFSSIGG